MPASQKSPLGARGAWANGMEMWEKLICLVCGEKWLKLDRSEVWADTQTAVRGHCEIGVQASLGVQA